MRSSAPRACCMRSTMRGGRPPSVSGAPSSSSSSESESGASSGRRGSALLAATAALRAARASAAASAVRTLRAHESARRCRRSARVAPTQARGDAPAAFAARHAHLAALLAGHQHVVVRASHVAAVCAGHVCRRRHLPSFTPSMVTAFWQRGVWCGLRNSLPPAPRSQAQCSSPSPASLRRRRQASRLCSASTAVAAVPLYCTLLLLHKDPTPRGRCGAGRSRPRRCSPARRAAHSKLSLAQRCALSRRAQQVR